VTQAWMQDHYGIAVPLPGLLAANIVMFGMLIAAVNFRDLVRPSALVLALGGVTYPLYLLHQNIGYMAIEALSPTAGRWTAAGVVLVGMLAVSFFVWRLIETPARKSIVRLLASLAEPSTWFHQRQKLRQTAA
jgi:peptidoglycan/LPS O-acetylase OafA/YrhL